MKFNPICVKIHVDVSKIKFVDFLNHIGKIGDIMFDRKMPVVFLKYEKAEEDLQQVLHNLNLDFVYCENISVQDCVACDTLVKSWYTEMYDKEYYRWSAHEYQEQIDVALQNIQKAREAIQKKLKKGAQTDGDREEGRV